MDKTTNPLKGSLMELNDYYIEFSTCYIYISNLSGDQQLVCTCPPLESYDYEKTKSFA